MLKTHRPLPRAPSKEASLARKGLYPDFTEGDELLTVNVLDETGGARHIVHFELS